MGRLTGGAIVTRALKSQGVRRIFSLPGVGVFPIYDACLTEGIEIVGGRHEESVVQMAEGWARVAGEPAVALLAEGPGHANGIPGVATAHVECSPVVVISAIAENGCLGTGAFQELPQVEMCAPITKCSALLTDVICTPEFVSTAFRTATSAVPGPVHLSLPVNLLEKEVDETERLAPRPVPSANVSLPDPGLIERAVDLLARAKRPVILAGSLAYWSEAGEPLQRLLDITKVPMFTVERARGLVSDDHPYCLGDGYSSVNPAAQMLHHADVMVVLGERVDCRFAYGGCFGQAKVIHVYPDSAEVGKHCAVEIGFACDARAVVAAILEAARETTWHEKTAWLESLRQARREHEAHLDRLASSESAPLNPAYIVREIERFVTPNTVLVFDNGDFSAWARSALRARRCGGWQTSTFSGHLGTGLPFALGAQLASPKSPVVVLTGDGAMGFAVMELETAARHKLPVVIVIGNDAAWGVEKYYQATMYGADRAIATTLSDVRWDHVAKGLGCFGERVDTREALRPALARAFASGRPACIDVRIESTPSPLARSYVRVLRRRRAQMHDVWHR